MSAGAAASHPRRRVLLHAQHLSGVGHFVRMREIGRALAARHDVYLLDGGREVPQAGGDGVSLLPLPRIERRGSTLTPLDPALSLTETMSRRAAQLGDYVERLRPDVLIIEHFPFSKWQLRAEIEDLVAAVRAARPGARVVCSVRDIPRQTSHESTAAEAWQHTVVRALHDLFDALMVHGEEQLTPLAAHFPAAGEIRIPVAHTGIVVAPLPEAGVAARAAKELGGGAGHVLASIGGGADPADLLGHCERAWRALTAAGATGGRMLVLCGGLRDVAGARRGADLPSVLHTAFDPRFPAWLATAALSVSYAGYNTCAGLLAARVPAVIVPNPRMSDQPWRVGVMEALGAARLPPGPALSDEGLAAAMLSALGGPRPEPAVRLDGAARAARFVEELAG